MWPAAIPLAVAGMSMLGQHMSNQSNAASSRYATDRSMEDAQKNRDFQANMSSTAHQREMQDLKDAGLNPLLTATGGAGASTPGGATGNAQAFTGHQDPLSAGLTSAIEMKNLQLGMTKQAAEVDNLNATKGLTEAQTLESMKRSKIADREVTKSDYQNRVWKTFEPLMKKFEDRIDGVGAQKRLYWQKRPDGSQFFGPRKY